MTYYLLAAHYYGEQADHLARLYGSATSSSRRQLRRKIELLRRRERWMRARAANCAQVPAAVSREASVAAHWRRCADRATRERDFIDAMQCYRAAVRAAGVALREHLSTTSERAA